MGHDTDDEATRARHRARIDENRDEEGVSLSVPSYADSGGVADLGVDEPVVPKAVQGEHDPNEPDLPIGTALPRRDRDADR